MRAFMFDKLIRIDMRYADDVACGRLIGIFACN
jgi:hypothetical protein